ncbi:hypothetical protein [Desulfurobacterium crinifex]
MKTLAGFCKELGIAKTSVFTWVWKFPEMQQFISVKRVGLRYRYLVKDEKGLKRFLKQKGYPIPEEAKHA